MTEFHSQFKVNLNLPATERGSSGLPCVDLTLPHVPAASLMLSLAASQIRDRSQLNTSPKEKKKKISASIRGRVGMHSCGCGRGEMCQCMAQRKEETPCLVVGQI